MNKRQLDLLIAYIDARVSDMQNINVVYIQEQLYKTVAEEEVVLETHKAPGPLPHTDNSTKVQEKTQENIQEISRKLRDITIQLTLISEQYRDLNV